MPGIVMSSTMTSGWNVSAAASAAGPSLALPTNARTVRNPRYAQGQSTSLAAGLAACAPDSEAVIVLLGDQPGIREDHVRALVTAFAETQAEVLRLSFRGGPGPALLARSVWQMTPMSSFLRRLQRGAWPPGVRFTSLYSKEDRVAPFPSTLIETSGLPYLRNVEVEAEGHRAFLYRKRVYDALLGELREGEAAAPVHLGKLSVVPDGDGPEPSSAAR